MTKEEHLQILKNEAFNKIIKLYKEYICRGWYDNLNIIEIRDSKVEDIFNEYKSNLKDIEKNKYSKKTKWKKIKDNKIINIWVKAKDDDCKYDIKPVEINPDWYQDNGTPICSCGMDLVYSHTEVFI